MGWPRGRPKRPSVDDGDPDDDDDDDDDDASVDDVGYQNSRNYYDCDDDDDDADYKELIPAILGAILLAHESVVVLLCFHAGHKIVYINPSCRKSHVLASIMNGEISALIRSALPPQVIDYIYIYIYVHPSLSL